MRFSRARGPGPSPPRRWRPRVSRLGTRALALLLSGLLGATADGEEPEPGIRVRPADPRPREIRPQEILTVPFRATNPSLEARELVEQIQAPPGWRLLAEPGTFRLSPGASEIRLLSVYVPVTTLAGRYPLLYRVEDSRQRGVADQAPIEVTVRPVLQLEVRPETVPERVIAGKTYTAVLQVLSRSNVPLTIALQLQSSHEFPAAVDPAQFPLGPGAGQQITVQVLTREDLDQTLRHQLRVEAQATGAGQTRTAQARLQVDVLARVTGQLDRYRRIPARWTTTWGQEDGANNVLWELSGAGALDEAQTRKVDFQFRQPLNDDAFLFGFEEEYRFSYLGPAVDLHLGDRGYGFSPLTEQYRFGRGLESQLHRERLRLGGYYLETQRAEPLEQQAGGTLGYQFLERFGADLNYLKKKRTRTTRS